MPESDSFGTSLLDPSAKPLPWTKGGPNEDSKQQQPIASLINSSVADPIFTIKNRVVTMKDLEALKKRLPPGIDIRITATAMPNCHLKRHICSRMRQNKKNIIIKFIGEFIHVFLIF